ncbi:unnamed protein product [Cunninghamella blakesleeana]
MQITTQQEHNPTSSPDTLSVSTMRNSNNNNNNNNNNMVNAISQNNINNINIPMYNTNNNNLSAFVIPPQTKYETVNEFNMSPPQPTVTQSMPIHPSKIKQQQQWYDGTSPENIPFSPTSPIARDIIISPSSSSSHLEQQFNEDNETQHQQMQEIFDKRRRRRESHNLVERRRRDNINDKIHELSSLLPPEMTEIHQKNPVTGLPKVKHGLNKGMILKLSVEHIKDLHNQVIHYQQRISELEQMIPISQQQQYSQLHFNHINPNSPSPSINLMNKHNPFSNFSTPYEYK